MEIIDYVAQRKALLREEVSQLKKKPSLVIISVGTNNPASESYVKGKMKDAEELGILCSRLVLDENVSQDDLLATIERLNKDDSVNGIIVQLPVPKSISEAAIAKAVSPNKDVDGFSSESLFLPCTPKGIVDYLSSEGFEFKGNNAVVLGRSNIVGKPLAKLLLNKDMNVTVLHSKTSEEDKRFYLAHADLVVVAIGKEAYLNSSYSLKESAFVVDVGINRGVDGKLHGDCAPGLKVRCQTPVPRGVGLLTRLSLMENVLEASKL